MTSKKELKKTIKKQLEELDALDNNWRKNYIEGVTVARQETMDSMASRNVNVEVAVDNGDVVEVLEKFIALYGSHAAKREAFMTRSNEGVDALAELNNHLVDLKEDAGEPESLGYVDQDEAGDGEMNDPVYNLMVALNKQAPDVHTIVESHDGNGDVNAWIKVKFTEPEPGIDYMTKVFSYRGTNFLEYTLWNETKLRDVELANATKANQDLTNQLEACARTINRHDDSKKIAESKLRDKDEIIQGLRKEVARLTKDLAVSMEATQELIEAIRLIVEYVGTHVLQPIEGWRWYDALVKYAPQLAARLREAESDPKYTTKPKMDPFLDGVTTESGHHYNAQGKRMIKDNPQA